MTIRIACLHTAISNIAVFEAAARGLDVSLIHVVRDDLLWSAEAQGGVTPDIARQTANALLAMTSGTDAVLLTCSTVGRGAIEAATLAEIPIMRTDEALADAAVANGGRVVVLCAVSTTLEPTRALFDAAAVATGATVDVRLIDTAAWTAFRAGDEARYFEIIAAACEAAFDDGADCVALAQASMAAAAATVTRGPVFTSPSAGLLRAREAVQGRMG